MLRRERLYILLLVGLVGLAVGLQFMAPRPVDWRDSFGRDDARPYASAVIFDLLPRAFPQAAVEAVTLPPYLRLRRGVPQGAAYVFVTANFVPDAFEAERLLAHAEAGGVVFVAADHLDGLLADTLGLATRPRFRYGPDSLGAARLRFTSPSLGPVEGYPVREQAMAAYLAAFDTSRTAVLAVDDADAPVLARLTVGRGAVMVSTTPRLFTNAHALAEGSRAAVWAALSHVPADVPAVLWDAHYKPGRTDASTPLRFVLQQPALRRAYYLALALVVLFLAVRGRRTQRPIPVVRPSANATVGFVETVGRLYFEQGDHADLARKKATHFLDAVRTHLNLPVAGPLDDAWAARLADRAGVPLADARAARDAAQAARRASGDDLSAQDLLALCRRLDALYAQSPRLRQV